MRAPEIRLLLCLLFGLNAAPPAHSQSPEQWLKKGAALIQSSRPFEAEEALKRIREGEKEYTSAQTMLGYIYLKRGALPLAGEAFDRSLAKDAGDSHARLGLGITLAHRGLLREAAGEFEKILNDPSFGMDARVQEIQCKFWLGREEEALLEARQQSELHPSIAAFQSLAGFLSHVGGRSEDALRFYRRALDLEPRKPENLLNLAGIYRSRQDWSSTLFLLQQALDLDPNQPLIHEDLAVAYSKLGRHEEARAEQAEAKRTLEAEILYTQATRERLAGRFPESQRLLRECAQKNPRLAKAWIDLGEMARRNGRLEEAVSLFRSAVDADPSSNLARLGLAASEQARAAGRLPGSETDETPSGKTATRIRMVAAGTNDADLLASVGRLFENDGSNREALKAYSDALNINPLQMDALLGRARSFLKKKEYEKAIEGFRSITEIDPSQASGWHGLIQAYRDSNSAGSSESACRACLSRLDGDNFCREQLAYLLLEANDYRGAASQFEEVIRRGHSSKDTLDGFGYVLRSLGDYLNAERVFMNSLREHGDDPWVWNNLGYVRQNLGNLKGAIRSYRKAVELGPRNAVNHHSLGFALYLARDYASAVEPLRESIRLRPDWGIARYNLAMTYWNLREYALALSQARIAEEKKVPGAAGAVRALNAALALNTPRMVEVFRRKS